MNYIQEQKMTDLDSNLTTILNQSMDLAIVLLYYSQFTSPQTQNHNSTNYGHLYQ